MTEREFAIAVVRRLRQAGYQALWAGGCVRDELLGLTPQDYDVATDARPEEVRRLFPRSLMVGASFGVVEVLGPRTEGENLHVQVATFRSDVSYTDGRHPDQVIFATAYEDALRRDFTINGMFFDPLENRLIDYVDGRRDLELRRLRAIGDPQARFAEDKLRMLRAVRIAARFDLEIEADTAAAIQRMADQIRVVSAERIADELRKMLVHARRSRGMRLLDEMWLMEPILPELVPMKGLPQGPPTAPTGDLWTHVLKVLDFLGPEVSFPLAFAALVHDVGKPRTVARTADRYTFHHHEHVGKRMAGEMATRLRLSNAERERIEWLVEKHQFLCDARQMRTAKLKATLAHPGIRELLALHRADALASGRSTDHVDYCEFLLREWTEADLNPPPLLTGHDLTRHGLEPGPEFKTLLAAVREAQLEGTIKTPQEALALVDRLRQSSAQ
ncbi:MAG: CCA tRNA nucleotidyltransferase [Gemmataceae bacterium]|nr:CCA tRNA nucleotidyltransferase [Gemmataceae bacterium]MDW8267424.1 CCA tRNA nucleotidyltransferase [Gemmataceae bacterium]